MAEWMTAYCIGQVQWQEQHELGRCEWSSP